MPHCKTVFAVMAFLLVSISDAKEVCFNAYGCFSDAAPFDNPSVPLPQAPWVIWTAYKVFTRVHYETPHIIDDCDVTKLQASGYDGDKSTAILVHGFNEHSGVPWINIMKNKLLTKEDFNIIIVEWSKGAKAPYNQAAGNTRIVGAQMAELITFLINNTNSKPESFYFVGFDLGAHAAGFAGKRVGKTGAAPGRITGLDPARQYFEAENPNVRLNSTDAQFVDVIHTDSKTNGIERPVGDLDFYPNGGEVQKGCGLSIGVVEVSNHGCDHKRAIEYFIESILTTCPMRAFPCENMAYFVRGWCIFDDEAFPSMGFNAYKSKGLTPGIRTHLLLTNSMSPFCVYHYTVSFKTGTGLFATFVGRLTVRIFGENDDTGDILLTKRNFLRATLHSFVVTSFKDHGKLTRLEVRHDGIPLITQWGLNWAVVKPAWGGDSNYYSACFDANLNSFGAARRLHQGRPGDIGCRL